VVRTDLSDALLTVTLNRPERRNALDPAMRDALAATLDQGARERARRMLRRAPLSYGAAKRLVALAADTDLHGGILAESMAQTALLVSEDHREGLAAAREKREPEFAAR
jgi:enoyl-CoA hydratase/carnithine racemase